MSNMTMTLEVLTPEQAICWLDKVPTYQRHLSPRRVAAIAWDIRRGEWMPTHQAVAFSEDDELMDGQHRVAGCVSAEMPIETWVCRGVPRTSYVAIDAGRPRSINEVSDVTKEQAAIVRALFQGPHYSGAQRLTNSQVIELRDAYRHAIDAVIRDTSTRIANVIQLSGVPRAAMVRAKFHMDTDSYARAMFLLIHGPAEVNLPGDASILRLRDYVIGGYRSRSVSADSREIVYAKVESAMRAFIEGRDLTKLQAVASELFPLPDEQTEEQS